MSDERNDFFERLLVIANQAEGLLASLPPGLDRTRAQHIASTARLLIARLDVVDPVVFRAQPASSASAKKS